MFARYKLRAAILIASLPISFLSACGPSPTPEVIVVKETVVVTATPESQVPTQPPTPTEPIEVTVARSNDNGAATFEFGDKEITFYPVNENALDSPLSGVKVQVCEQGEYIALYVQSEADSALVPQFMLLELGELATEQRIILSEEIHFTRIDDIAFDPGEWHEITSLPAEDAGAYMVNELGENSLILFVPVDGRGEVLVDIRDATVHFLESPFPQVEYVWVEPPASSSRGGLLAAPVMNPLGIPPVMGHYTGIHFPHSPAWKPIEHLLPHPHPDPHMLEDFTKFWERLWGLHEDDETMQVQTLVVYQQTYLAPGAPAVTELVAKVEPIAPLPTEEPTAEPTEEPTAEPTEEPTTEPTEEPTAEPTEEPTAEPTEEPTAEPTEEPTAEPTGRGRIAFQSHRDGNNEIYVMNADGSEQTNLTNSPANDWTPSWSPGGTRITFHSDRDEPNPIDQCFPNCNYEIYVMNADGSGLTRLTDNPAHDRFPSWSPDGMHIAFVSDRDGNDEIYVMNADGSGLTRLTDNPRGDTWPTWSPDGTHIAFTSQRDGNPEIYVMNADGSGQIRMTEHPEADECPAWSPDGMRIAFDSWRDGTLDIYVMNADGSGLRNLTNSPAWDQDSCWSPDGTRIAFVSDRDGNREIYVMNADGSGQTRLTNSPDGDWSPSWSPR